jgi:hypothetical protein
VAFDLTAPTMYTSWMYNYWAWAGTPENGFLWDYGDGGSTPYALDNNHIYATAAYYSINMYYYYEAWTSFTAIDSVEDFIDVCVGVNENNAEKILLSPNPNNGSFTLENALGYRIEIYNMLGMPVLSTEVTETRLALDLGAYARGAYVIRFSSNNSQFSKTILVE